MPEPTRHHQTPGDRRARQAAMLLQLGFECVPGPTTTFAECVDGRWRLTQALPAMGTRVSITAIDASRDRAEAAIGGAWDAMHRAIRQLSRHDPDSPLCVLNTEGRVDGAPAELLTTLQAARHLHSRSDGAFDVTVLPVLQLVRSRPEAAAADLDAELREALSLVGDRGLLVRGHQLRLQRPGMGVTLDGIAKGRVVDLVAAALQGSGVRDYLVDAGGDIRVGGLPPAGSAWKVGVRDPAGRGLLEQTVELRSGAIATSGSYEIWFDEERSCHHVVSPVDGRSPGTLVSVTVAAPSAMLADGLATAAFLLGPAAGPDFVDSFAGCACLMVTREGRQLSSRHWQHVPRSRPHGEDRR